MFYLQHLTVTLSVIFFDGHDIYTYFPHETINHFLMFLMLSNEIL